MALFAEDTHFVVFYEWQIRESINEIEPATGLAPVFNDLNKHEATTHFMEQSTVILTGDCATGETYCIAHHVPAQEGQWSLSIASLRDLDNLARVNREWLTARGMLIVDWTDTRPITG